MRLILRSCQTDSEAFPLGVGRGERLAQKEPPANEYGFAGKE